MKKFIIRQTIEVEIHWLIDAEDKDSALEKAWDNFDSSKVTDIYPLSWDKPWDAEEVDGDVRLAKPEELEPWKAVGIL